MSDYNVTVEIGGEEVTVSLEGSAAIALEVVNELAGNLSFSNDNSFAGVDAGDSITSGTGNTGFGVDALTLATSATNNTAFGHLAGQGLTTGGSNTLIGRLAGQLGVTISQCTAVGGQALRSNVSGSACTAVGYQAANLFLGTEITAIGHQALTNTTGIQNVALGASAGGRITTGIRNTFLGNAAGGGIATPVDLQYGIGIGYNVQVPTSGMIVIGDTNQEMLKLFGINFCRYNPVAANLVIGSFGASPSTWTGGVNLGIGTNCFSVATTASSNLAVGPYALEEIETGNGNCVVGVAAGRTIDAAFDCTLIGNIVARFAVNGGTGLTAVGYRSHEFATALRNNAGLGDSTLWRSQGDRCVAIGYRTAEYNGSGDDCIYIGSVAGVNRESGDRNILIGTGAGGITSAVITPDDEAGTAAGTVAAGDRNVGIGHAAIREFLGDDTTAVGDLAGFSTTGGGQCVFIGSDSGNDGSQKVDATNSIAIGYGSFTTLDNQVVLGNASVTQTVLRGVQLGTVLTVATLPAAAAGLTGARSFVSDANATMTAGIGAVVAGGGSNKVPVYCDGTNWRIG